MISRFIKQYPSLRSGWSGFLKKCLASRSLPPLPSQTDIPKTALFIIDVQAQFVDPKTSCRGTAETDQTAQKIARLAPLFRNAGIRIYAVRYDGIREDTRFHYFTPDKADIIISKRENSVILGRCEETGKQLREVLDHHDHGKVLVCGFNLHACVADSVCDLRRICRRDVYVMRDLCGVALSMRVMGDMIEVPTEDIEDSCISMQWAGARMTTSAEIGSALGISLVP